MAESEAASGRSPEGRTITVTTSLSSAAITAPAGTFHEEDVGRTISGTGIPANATISSVTSPTAATMSANATAAGTVTATLGAGKATDYGFSGWSPETDTESETHTIPGGAGASAPSRITAQGVRRKQRYRS